jgi:hypothetical protein
LRNAIAPARVMADPVGAANAGAVDAANATATAQASGAPRVATKPCGIPIRVPTTKCSRDSTIRI